MGVEPTMADLQSCIESANSLTFATFTGMATPTFIQLYLLAGVSGCNAGKGMEIKLAVLTDRQIPIP